MALDVHIFAGSMLRGDRVESIDYTINTQSAVVSCSLDVRWMCGGHLVRDYFRSLVTEREAIHGRQTGFIAAGEWGA